MKRDQRERVARAKMMRARELRREATQAEQLLWERLRARRFNGWKFRRQQVIAGFIVDFYCDKARLVIEVDGPIHQTQQDYDEHRDQVLRQEGLHILRVTNADIEMDIERVLERVKELLRPSPPGPRSHLTAGEGEPRDGRVRHGGSETQ